MSWTIPDLGESGSPVLSIPYREYWDIKVAGDDAVDCVINGLSVTSNNDLTFSIAKGGGLSNRALFARAAGVVTIPTPDSINPRLDFIVVDSSANFQVRTGTPAAFTRTSAPKPPSRSANDVVLGVVYVAANATALNQTLFSDKRVPKQGGPLTVLRDVTQQSVSSQSSPITFFAQTLPSGLMVPTAALPRQYLVRAGGNLLISNTATITVTVNFGGSPMWSANSTTALTITGSAVKRAWELDIVLSAAAQSVQRVGGHFMVSEPFVAPHAPASGTAGVIQNLQNIPAPIDGFSAVDADAADRTVTVQFTMSVADAANTFIKNWATAQLL